jgi:hypothetical protein
MVRPRLALVTGVMLAEQESAQQYTERGAGMNRAIHLAVAVTLLASALLASCQMGIVRGSGRIATNEYSFKDFSQVEISSSVGFEIVRSNSYRVSISIDDNLIDYVQVSQSGSTLRIQMKRAMYANISVKASIEMPTLTSLRIDGASKGSVSGFDSTESLKTEVSGASALDMDDISAGNVSLRVSGASWVIGSVDAADMVIDASGASTVQLGGSGDDILVRGSGASNINLAALEVNNADVSLSGASSATVNMDGRLDADLSGASGLRYLGAPTLGNLKTSGNSTISKK